MARIAGVNIPENKHVEISLTHIFGIGRKTAQDICKELKIDYTRKISDLTEDEIENLRTAIGKFVVEGDLRRNISTNIILSEISKMIFPISQQDLKLLLVY